MNFLKRFFQKKIAKHLRKPIGRFGKKVAQQMNTSNADLINLCIDKLDIKNQEKVLEIGFGNGKHMERLVSKSLSVVGIDYSKTMVEEAKKINTSSINNGKLELSKGDIDHITFDDHSFDKIITVNTLYFWPSPKKNASSLKRLLKKGGTLAIGIRPKSSAEQFDFTHYGFQLYDPEDVVNLLIETGFNDITTHEKEDKFGTVVCILAS